jgi:hypothetical protein
VSPLFEPRDAGTTLTTSGIFRDRIERGRREAGMPSSAANSSGLQVRADAHVTPMRVASPRIEASSSVTSRSPRGLRHRRLRSALRARLPEATGRPEHRGRSFRRNESAAVPTVFGLPPTTSISSKSAPLAREIVPRTSRLRRVVRGRPRRSARGGSGGTPVRRTGRELHRALGFDGGWPRGLRAPRLFIVGAA